MNKKILQLILVLLLSLSLFSACTDDKQNTDGNKTSTSENVSNESSENSDGASPENEKTTSENSIELPKVPF